jgi:hypothetical protein
MAFKGRMMSLQNMHDVPVVCLWCIWHACDACGVACGFSRFTFFRFPISLTTYQHLKALQIIYMHLNGLQRSYVVTTDYEWCACGVPVVNMTCLWCLWWCLCVFWTDFFSFSYLIDFISTFKNPSNHSYASEWPSKGWLMSLQIMHNVPMVCLWCIWHAGDACGGACRFSGLPFSRIPISLTTYQHLKALQIIYMYLNGL